MVTEKIEAADVNGVLLIPGGQGTRTLVNDAPFIEKLSGMAKRAEYCLTVCTGTALLAKTGLIDGKTPLLTRKALEWAKG